MPIFQRTRSHIADSDCNLSHAPPERLPLTLPLLNNVPPNDVTMTEVDDVTRIAGYYLSTPNLNLENRANMEGECEEATQYMHMIYR